MTERRPQRSSPLEEIVKTVRLGARIAAHDLTHARFAVQSRLPMPRKERLRFPQFPVLVAPLSPREAVSANFHVAGIIEKESGKLAAELPESVCRALGLTAENAQIIDVLKGSEHTKAGIIVVHVEKSRQTGDIVVKFGPDVAREPRTTKLAREGAVGRVGGMILPGVGHEERGVSDVSFIAMPLVPDSYKSMRELLDAEQVSPRVARRWANTITTLNAIGMRDKLSRNFTGERMSMQFSELDSYRSGLSLAAACVESALERQGIGMPLQSVWDMSLRVESGKRGLEREYPSLSKLEDRMLQVLEQAKTTPFVAVGHNEDDANKNYHANVKGVVVAELDHGYAAEAHQGTLIPVALALAAKALNTGSVKTTSDPPQLTVSSGAHGTALAVEGLQFAYAVSAKAYHDHAMVCLPRLARRIVGKKDAPELLAQTYEHLAVNYINTIASVARKLQKTTTSEEESHLMKLLFHAWGQVGEAFSQADEIREKQVYISSRRCRDTALGSGQLVA